MAYDVRHWNAKVGRRAGFAKELTAQFSGADVAVILEPGGHRVAIRAWALTRGYRIHAARDGMILVRRGVRVYNKGAVDVKTPWTGPKGRKREGRGLPWLTAIKPGNEPLLVMAMHAVWNPRENWAAHVAITRATRKFMNARTTVDKIIPGDWNWGWGQIGEGSPRALAGPRNLNGQIVAAKNHNIDFAIYVPRTGSRPEDHGQRPRPMVTTAKVGPREKSDHHSIRYNVRSTA